MQNVKTAVVPAAISLWQFWHCMF